MTDDEPRLTRWQQHWRQRLTALNETIAKLAAEGQDACEMRGDEHEHRRTGSGLAEAARRRGADGDGSE